MRWGVGQGDPSVIYGPQLPRPPRKIFVIKSPKCKVTDKSGHQFTVFVRNDTETEIIFLLQLSVAETYKHTKKIL